MNLTKYLERFDRLHHMIRRKATGSPAELAEKLNLSERATFEYIRVMREMGAPIAFCPHRRTYYYEREVQFNMGFLELYNDVTGLTGRGNE
ncbi:HTH domain-containing protein [Dyadobacter sp. LHD-138]|uniref:HTH domain-containing protein n=1 Tax=Dyadobacter sp. LHD-138 TaxID=3071413 RepID=UPI0027DF6109|nr:HTH domain-containing protein [Dyadobacter sp. LHD-138]MDQ6477418.1 HTH domain-containing protein [Dyadobacter sp. LHD-138]